MKIGTPLTSCSVKIMLLGSGELGKEVAIALQRFGIEVIAVDRYKNAPAHQVAHRSFVINMTDADALKAIIFQEKPHIIVPEIEAIATSVLLEIEQEGIAEVIPNARAVHLTMNREGIRRLAAEECGLPTSPFAFAENITELHDAIEKDIGYPCFIKPVMSSSGKGQSLVHCAEDLQKAWDNAATAGRHNQGKVIVEGLIDFDYEITQLTVRAKDASGNIQTYFCDPIGHIQKQGDYIESWQPHNMSPMALKRARDIAQKITDNLGGRGVFGVELFVKGDDVWFSEVSPRPHDTGLVTLCTQKQNEFELHTRAILGLPVDVMLQNNGASAVIYGGMDTKEVCFENIAQALSVPQSDMRLFGKPEAFVKRRMGVALANGHDITQARQRAKDCANLVKIYQHEDI